MIDLKRKKVMKEDRIQMRKERDPSARLRSGVEEGDGERETEGGGYESLYMPAALACALSRSY